MLLSFPDAVPIGVACAEEGCLPFLLLNPYDDYIMQPGRPQLHPLYLATAVGLQQDTPTDSVQLLSSQLAESWSAQALACSVRAAGLQHCSLSCMGLHLQFIPSK